MEHTLIAASLAQESDRLEQLSQVLREKAETRRSFFGGGACQEYRQPVFAILKPPTQVNRCHQ